MAISMEEILMGRAELKDLPQDIQDNLNDLLPRLNVIRTAYGKPLTVNSGLRRQSDNDATANAAKSSSHLVGMAVDLKDTTNEFWTWCVANLELIQAQGLYLEDRRWTPTWVHLSTRPPGSGKRIFVPSSAPAIAPKLWSGVYDRKFDAIV
jgi:hypothetical protein